MKFDVIVENPPYQHPTNKRWKLWVNFLEKSIDSLEDKGYLLFISPFSWFNSFGEEIEKARKIIFKNNLIEAINANKYFPKIGENIWYIVLTKENYKGITDINGEKKISFKENGKNYLNEDDKIKIDIITKVKDSNLPKISEKAERYLTSKKNVGKFLKTEKDEEFKYEIYHTASQRYFSNDKRLEKKLTPKIIINMSGNYYSPKNPDKYMFVTDNVIAGRAAYEVPTKTLEQAKNIKSFLTSKLYRFFVDEVKSSGFNFAPWALLPMLSENKKWTDEEIYDYFKLTDEERKYVNNHKFQD